MTAFAEQLISRQTKNTVEPTAKKPAPTPAPAAPVADKPAVTAVKKPVQRISITVAAQRTGMSRDTIYRLYKAGLIRGWQPSPKKVLLDAEDLEEYLAVSAQPGFWTRERKAKFNRKAES